MKDYTISHPCGLEQWCSTLKQARKDAKQHKKECYANCGLDMGFVAIDEYDTEEGDMGGGELTGRYWKI